MTTKISSGGGGRCAEPKSNQIVTARCGEFKAFDSKGRFSTAPAPSLLHFVRFASLHDQRYQNAVRVFGPPDYLHRYWDRRALREIAAGDVIVFAKGEADQSFVPFNGDDEAYARARPESAVLRRDHG